MSVNLFFEKLPETLEEFEKLPEATLATPFDTARLLVLALAVYPTDKKLSLQLVNVLRGPREMTEIDKQFLADRFRGKEYLMRSYFEGAVPENDYTPDTPLVITVNETANSYTQEGLAKLFIKCGGADSPRPVTLRKAKDGKWYAWEYSSILLGIRQPESASPW